MPIESEERLTIEDAKVSRRAKRAVHRRSSRPGMLIHEDLCRHEWVPGKTWDLVVTMDDATGEHYSMIFTQQGEGTLSSLVGVRDVLLSQGNFHAFTCDYLSRYLGLPEVSGKVDRHSPAQLERLFHQLGIKIIAANSPEVRGRVEQAFTIHQDRLVKELALCGITEMAEANRYLDEHYRPAFNDQFMESVAETGSAFVPLPSDKIEDILCEHYERIVMRGNRVFFQGLSLQIPVASHCCDYMKAKVRVDRYSDGSLAIFDGQCRLADYYPDGQIKWGD